MGTSGMRYSLQSREIIADSIETVTQGQWYDANISLPGCDKNMVILAFAFSNFSLGVSLRWAASIVPPSWSTVEQFAQAVQPLRITLQSISYPPSNLMANILPTKSTRRLDLMLSAMPVLDQGRAEGCILQTPWLQPRKLWV